MCGLRLLTAHYRVWVTVTVLLVCPDVPVCWAHGLLFIVGAMCSHVYCLPPPIFLPNHCFSCFTRVSLVCLSICPPGVCSPVLIHCLTLCMFVKCTQLFACLFFPFWVIFVYLCFILLLKRPSSCIWDLALISPVDSWQSASPGALITLWGIYANGKTGFGCN